MMLRRWHLIWGVSWGRGGGYLIQCVHARHIDAIALRMRRREKGQANDGARERGVESGRVGSSRVESGRVWSSRVESGRVGSSRAEPSRA